MQMDRHPRRRQNLQKRRINNGNGRLSCPPPVPIKNDEPVDAHTPPIESPRHWNNKHHGNVAGFKNLPLTPRTPAQGLP
jgi:hypothetical protein